MTARCPRVYHTPLDGEAGQTIRLDRDESHHVHRVLRLRAGEALGVFDGAGTEWGGVVERLSADGVEVRLTARLCDRVEAPLEVVLFQSSCRTERMEWAIQKATEVGVAAIHPLAGVRAETPPPTPARLQRWRRIALAACKQCGRRTVPRIEPVEQLPTPGPRVLALLLDTGPAPRPIAERIDASGGTGAVWLAVGPEGGFSDEEAARWVEGGWLPSGLGPRTLRAETAGVVAAAIVLHLRGDLGSGGPSG